MLQEQEQGEVLGPQSAPPDGAAALAEQRAAAAAQRQADMEASRAVESPDDEIYQSTGAQVPRSVRMGINPADGPLSTGAAMAVDTGVSDQMQQAAALAQAAEAGEKSGKAQKQEQPARSPLGADPETGEIPGSDDVANWSDAQLSEVFRGAQGRDVRIKLAQELSRRKAARAAEQSTPVKGTTDGPQAQPASTQPPAAAQAPAVAAAGAPAQGTLINGGTTTADAGAQAKTAAGAQAAPESKDQRAQRIDAAGQTWTRLPTVQRQVVAEQLKGLKPVLQKKPGGRQVGEPEQRSEAQNCRPDRACAGGRRRAGASTCSTRRHGARHHVPSAGRPAGAGCRRGEGAAEGCWHQRPCRARSCCSGICAHCGASRGARGGHQPEQRPARADRGPEAGRQLSEGPRSHQRSRHQHRESGRHAPPA